MSNVGGISGSDLIVEIRGLKEAEAAFPEPLLLKKMLGNAAAVGARVYRSGVKAKAAGAFKDTATKRHPAGTLRRTIRYRRVTKLGGISAEAGPLGKAKFKTTPLAHLVDSGHGGPHPAPAHPFVDPAFQSYEEAAVGAAEAYLFAAIDAARAPDVPSEG